MSELKTLKDLYKTYQGKEAQFWEWELRQEAIKHIKNKIIRTTWTAEEFIEYFFNITEEDLK